MLAFGSENSKTKYIRLSEEYVRRVLGAGRENCEKIYSAIKEFTDGKVNFPVNEEASLQISLAVLGTSFAVLVSGSPLMKQDKACKVITWCKVSIEKDLNLPQEAGKDLITSVNEYEDIFHKSMERDENPFGNISGHMLVSCLGSFSTLLCSPDNRTLDPIIHQVVGDLLTIMVMEALIFWKDK